MKINRLELRDAILERLKQGGKYYYEALTFGLAYTFLVLYVVGIVIYELVKSKLKK